EGDLAPAALRRRRGLFGLGFGLGRDRRRCGGRRGVVVVDRGAGQRRLGRVLEREVGGRGIVRLVVAVAVVVVVVVVVRLGDHVVEAPVARRRGRRVLGGLGDQIVERLEGLRRGLGLGGRLGRVVGVLELGDAFGDVLVAGVERVGAPEGVQRALGVGKHEVGAAQLVAQRRLALGRHLGRRER